MNIADYIAGSAAAARQVQIEQVAARLRDGYSRTQELLDTIAERGQISTAELGHDLGLTHRQVWGLLKQPRAAGKVNCTNGRWTRSTAWEERRAARAELQAQTDDAAAVEYLASRGWTCVPPNDNGNRSCADEQE